MFAHHIFIDRPECFILIVIGFDRPTKFIQFQRIKNASSTRYWTSANFLPNLAIVVSSIAITTGSLAKLSGMMLKDILANICRICVFAILSFESA